jgi:hypothetical protein
MAGQEAFDCEQLVVSFQQLYIGPPGDEATAPQRCNSPRSAVLKATVVREIPTNSGKGLAPASNKIEEGSYISAVDAWVLLDCVAFLDQWETTGAFGLGVIGTVDVPSPEGGFQAVSATFTRLNIVARISRSVIKATSAGPDRDSGVPTLGLAEFLKCGIGFQPVIQISFAW